MGISESRNRLKRSHPAWGFVSLVVEIGPWIGCRRHSRQQEEQVGKSRGGTGEVVFHSYQADQEARSLAVCVQKESNPDNVL